MNDIKFICPQCNKYFEAPSDIDGRLIECPKCQHPYEVPHSNQTAPVNSFPTPRPPRVSTPIPVSPGPQSSHIQPAISIPQLKTSGFAIASLVSGILGLLLGGLIIGFGPILSILSIVFGHVAYSQIKQQPTILTGKGMAMAGFSLGYLSIVLSFVILVLAVCNHWQKIHMPSMH